jgi:hypothetical protein
MSPSPSPLAPLFDTFLCTVAQSWRSPASQYHIPSPTTIQSCANVAVQSWTGSAPLPLSEFPSNSNSALQINLSPVVNGVALLGELSKVTAVSVYRFASIAAGAKTGTLDIALRGKPGEAVLLAYAVVTSRSNNNNNSRSRSGAHADASTDSSLFCQSTTATIGPDGTAHITIPPQ